MIGHGNGEDRAAGRAKLTKPQLRALRMFSGDRTVAGLNPSTADQMKLTLHRLGLIDMYRGYALTDAGRATLAAYKGSEG